MKKVIRYLLICCILFGIYQGAIVSYAGDTGEAATDVVETDLEGTNDDADVTLNSPPYVVGVALGTSQTTFKKGDTLTVDITFSEAVTITGQPPLGITDGEWFYPFDSYEKKSDTVYSFQYTVENMDLTSQVYAGVMGDPDAIQEIVDEEGAPCDPFYKLIGTLTFDTEPPALVEIEVIPFGEDNEEPFDKHVIDYNIRLHIYDTHLSGTKFNYIWSTSANIDDTASYKITDEVVIIDDPAFNIRTSNENGNLINDECYLYFHVYLEDALGNAWSGVLSNEEGIPYRMAIDQLGPTIQVAPEELYSHDPTITMTIEDTISSVRSYEYELYNSYNELITSTQTTLEDPIQQVNIDFQPHMLDEGIIDGCYYIKIKAEDWVYCEGGNWSDYYTYSFIYDGTPPVINITNIDQEISGQQETVGFTVTYDDTDDRLDDQYLPYVTLQYKWEEDSQDTGEWHTLDEPLTSDAEVELYPDDTLGAGNYRLHLRVEDRAGNVVTTASNGIVFIPDNPTGTMAINKAVIHGKKYTNQSEVDLNLTVTEPEDSMAYSYRINGGTWSDKVDMTSPSMEVPVTLLPTEGEQTVEVSYSFQYGNKTYETSYSDSIIYDTQPPSGSITYTPDSFTENSVEATLAPTDNYTPSEYIMVSPTTLYFDYNDQQYFTVTDLAGNSTDLLAEVTWIASDAPIPTLTYSTKAMTQEDVTVHLSFPDYEGTVEFLNGDSHVFTENGAYQFKYKYKVTEDVTKEGTATAVVTNIDRAIPEVTLTPDLQALQDAAPSNQNVRIAFIPNEIVDIEIRDGNGELLTVLQNVKANQSGVYWMESNGILKATAIDRAGNQLVMEDILIDHLDKEPPTATLTYAIEGHPELLYNEVTKTKENVVVTVIANEPIKVQNSPRIMTRTYDKNGSYSFLISDLAGNTVSIPFEISIIDKSKPKLTLNYSTSERTAGPVTVTLEADREIEILNHNGSNTLTFNHNGMDWWKIRDELGNEMTKKVYVKNIDDVAPTITFDNYSVILIDKYDTFDPMADVTVVDDIDGDITDQVTVSHNVDNTMEGVYTIHYEAIDGVGNTMIHERTLEVLSDDYLTVYLQSDIPNDGTVVYNKDFSFLIYGLQGNYHIWWDKGLHETGHFKRPSHRLNSLAFEATETGWYTFYILDQERKYKLVKVYLSFKEGI